jgi:hypothetical protein
MVLGGGNACGGRGIGDGVIGGGCPKELHHAVGDGGEDKPVEEQIEDDELVEQALGKIREQG